MNKSNDTNQTNPLKQKLLPKITLSYGLMDEYDATLHTATVYSYLLCKYTWFKSQDKEYFESQPEIVRGSRVSLSAVKVAVKFLLDKGLVQIKKRKALNFCLNVYTVVDKYKVYDNLPSKTQNKPTRKFIDTQEELDSCPF
jgi:hypothetical protein